MKADAVLGFTEEKIDADGRLIEMLDKVKCIRISEFGKFEYRHTHDETEEWKEVWLNKMHAAYFPVIELLPVMLTGTRVSKYPGTNIPSCYRHRVCRLNTQNYRTYRNNFDSPD